MNGMRNLNNWLLVLFLLSGCSSSTNNAIPVNSDREVNVREGSRQTDKTSSSSYYSDNDNGTSTISDEDSDNGDGEEGLEDGEHSATVTYDNPVTGTHSTYNLDVTVEDNEVKYIHFPNGGYLGDYHYTSGGQLDDDNTTTITTDEGNGEYTVEVDD